MRIIGGTFRGRRIAAPAGTTVRPTTDRVREAWISIMTPRLSDATVLDLFAGSGALGLEALSRGARHATFVESAPGSLDALRRNIETLGVAAQTTVHRGDVLCWVAQADHDFDVAFADPPYGTGLATALADAFRGRPFADVLGIEHEPQETLDGDDTRRWGSVAVTFLETEDA